MNTIRNYISTINEDTNTYGDFFISEVKAIMIKRYQDQVDLSPGIPWAAAPAGDNASVETAS